MRALRLAVLFFVAAASTVRAVDSAAAASAVKDAESAFAKAFADREQAKFFAFVAEDANFLSPNRTLAGKPQIVETWSRFFKDQNAPFAWRPERVVVNGAGDIGLSTGPVLDPAGKHIGNFSSVWQKRKDGSWKVIFDGPGAPACPTEGEKK